MYTTLTWEGYHSIRMSYVGVHSYVM